jgi:hypothetical protein
VDVWNLLESRWPFTKELAEIPEINNRFGLTRENAFSPDLRPVFFVGDLSTRPEVLLVGMKPGLNGDSNAAFQHERRAIGGDFASYKTSRISYFGSDSLNRRHYWPAAKAAASVLGEPFPDSPGPYLAGHAIQAELLPFFAPSAGLSDQAFIEVCRTSAGGDLARLVREALLTMLPWKAVIVRYAQTFRVFCELHGARLESSTRAVLQVHAREIPVYALTGRYVADSDILRMTGAPAEPGPHVREGKTPGDWRAGDPGEAFAELREYVITLGTDVTPLPRRTNGSFVFKRRRNFATLIPSSAGLRMDIYTGTSWHNGVRVVPGIGMDAAKRLVDEAYRLAGPTTTS